MSNTKIMVVDDQSTDRLMLQQILDKEGFRVVTATSGSECIQLAEGDLPDLIFLDIIMDEMDGFKTCRKLSKGEKTSKIPIVMVSSNNQKVDKLWALKQGARAYITKPYTSEQILEQVKKFA